MSTIKEKLVVDVKSAMKAKEKQLLNVLRLITAAIKQVEVDTRVILDDVAVLSILTKMVKQRQDSLSIYVKADRKDLAAQEQYEIDVINGYLPTQMTDAEVEALVVLKMTELNVSTAKDMSKLMSVLKPLVAGKADMSLVSKIVKQRI